MNLLGLERLIGAGLVVVVMAIMIRRWLRAGSAERRAVAPVVVAGSAALLALGWTVVFDLLGDPLGALPATISRYTFATVPLAVLFVFAQRRARHDRRADCRARRNKRSARPAPSAGADTRRSLVGAGLLVSR